jgi:hypothetical protein
MLSVCYRLARDAVLNWLLDSVTFPLECAWIVTCVLRFVSFAESYPDWRRAQTGTALSLLCAYKRLNIHCIRFLYEFLFNNQPDALIIPIYYVIKLYMFRASSLSIIRSFLLIFGTSKFHAGLMTAPKQSQDGTAVPSWLCLEAVIKNMHETYQCRM